MRLDQLLVQKGFCPGRDRAKELIQNGAVSVDGVLAKKASQPVSEDSELVVQSDLLRYVSRGGLKLEKALAEFPIDLTGKICMDIGASTGGFTDCMLQNGAAVVYAVDVGEGQLAQPLREDPRVINMENTNIRDLDNDSLPVPMDFISVDVSFLSLAHVFPVMRRFLKDEGEAVCLIKPQFEAGKGAVGKNGVVRDSKTHISVIRSVIALAVDHGLSPVGLTFSPVKGPNGNIEYLLHLMSRPASPFLPDIPLIVEHAKETLRQNGKE